MGLTKNGDVYRLDADAPEGVVRYLLVKKAKAPAKAKSPRKEKVRVRVRVRRNKDEREGKN